MYSHNWWKVRGWPHKTGGTEVNTPATHPSSAFHGLHLAMHERFPTSLFTHVVGITHINAQ